MKLSFKNGGEASATQACKWETPWLLVQFALRIVLLAVVALTERLEVAVVVSDEPTARQ